jgi:hypothetical protein
VVVLGTPSYSHAAEAEAESMVADQGSLDLALQISATSPISFGWQVLNLVLWPNLLHLPSWH